MTDCHLTRIQDYLELWATQHPDNPMWYHEGRHYNFGEVNQIVDHVASGLLKLGYQHGDKLGIIAHNQPEWLISYLAALKIGVTVVGLSVRYRDEELIYMLNQSEARGVIALAECNGIAYGDYLHRLKKEIPNLQDILLIDAPVKTHSSFEKLAATPVSQAALTAASKKVDADTASIIIYTSGTTGKPKGATLTHRSQLASALAQIDHLNMTLDDVLPVIAPLNHVGGLTCSAVATILVGGCALLIPQFSPAKVIELLAECPVTVMGAVPTMYTLLMQHPDFPSLNQQRVRVLLVGGASADEELINALRHHYPNIPILNNYGMSETSGFVLMSRFDENDSALATSVGIPIGDLNLKVVDDKNRELAIGEIGELCIRGSAVIKNYYQMPEKTAEAITTDGWLFSGDIALIDDKGCVHLKGRKKEMFLQGGFNVYPVEIENILTQHPDILLAAGIGVADKVLGEVGKYFIVRTPGSTLNEKQLLTFCRERMADYKVPRQIIFSNELPLTPAGKIMKSKLS